MRPEHLRFLVCPACAGELSLQREMLENGKIKTGVLRCTRCVSLYPIIGFIPRFITSDVYTQSFAFEWKKHARTMYDSFSGQSISEKRFFQDSGWDRNLRGQLLLEVGCGGGRFTEQAVSTGAMVLAADYSKAVEVSYENNAHHENVCFVQADLYALPFRADAADKILCFGVLQHTPDVKKAFSVLKKYLKTGGRIAADVYRYNWWRNIFVTRYWIRGLTKKMNHDKLYAIVKKYIEWMWPIANWIHKLPYGTYLNRFLLVREYRDLLPLSDAQLKEWAILDTFDNLAAYYDQPQSLATFRKWFHENGYEDIEVQYGGNGVLGRGRKGGPNERQA